MKHILRIIKATITGGILFLIPVILLAVVSEKAFGLSQKILEPIVHSFPDKTVAGIALKELFAVLLILILCFLAGLFASTKYARAFVRNIESRILSHIPGYTFMKKIGEGMIGLEGRDDLKVVLVRVDDAWQLAFLMEQ